MLKNRREVLQAIAVATGVLGQVPQQADADAVKPLTMYDEFERDYPRPPMLASAIM
ncbi:MAG: hypothetical protein UY83_C0001G0007 [Candidatus Adlerbacteria bacterium GW2011_GWA1_54_10]|uniref:Uncharacterized protein n=2 Tax=Candidatus Adleribacteriota TaxID=1752736 RepID=A0A0G1XY88_9BACT|nr:MAG: hypothetical protein UY83_C0001G0007 [Candidatus Adlerbacteria bacterium GW2011_GWA1_54_10]KKW37562.1 MAG: hypothetical protein UY86_C0006G0007 [Candidatus Adlerbacteria bacterium GW2011_GWB1_54_7]